MTQLLIFYLIASAVLVGLSIPLIQEKIPPNAFYGFRVRKTLSNPDIWYPVNVFAGKRLMAMAVSMMAASLLLYLVPGIGIDSYALGCLAVFGVSITICGIQCFQYLKTFP